MAGIEFTLPPHTTSAQDSQQTNKQMLTTKIIELEPVISRQETEVAGIFSSVRNLGLAIASD